MNNLPVETKRSFPVGDRIVIAVEAEAAEGDTPTLYEVRRHLKTQRHGYI